MAARTKAAREGHLSRPSSSLSALGAINPTTRLKLKPMLTATREGDKSSDQSSVETSFRCTLSQISNWCEQKMYAKGEELQAAL